MGMKNASIFAPPKERLKLSAYVFKYPREFWIQAAGGIIYNTVIVMGPVFLGRSIDAADQVMKGLAPVTLFYRNLLLFFLFTVCFQLARYFKRRYMREIVNRMKCDIRAGLLAAAFGRPMQELDHEKVGDMMSRMIGDVEQVGQSVQITITEVWDTFLLMISYFVACMLYSPRITLLAVIPVPLTLVLAELLRHPLYNLSVKYREAASKVSVHLQHTISGIALLRLFGREEAEREKLAGLLKAQLKWSVLTTMLQNGMTPVYMLTATCGVVAVVGMGGKLVVDGGWSIGMFTAYLALFTAMAIRTNVAAKVFNSWHGAKASWDRITDKLRQQIGADNASDTTCPASGQRGLLVSHLSFSFPTSENEAVSDLSFTAQPGQIIGITGPVGSGKSALAAALSGLYPYEGDVRVNGIPVSTNRHAVAYMDASHFVFSDDVAFNVGLGQTDDDQLLNALDVAMLSEDIARFSEGIHTRVGERGVRVSGGQRQRIALARAWASKADVLVLDDPFSAVDIALEQRIMENLRTQGGSRIILLFSHRLTTFSLTDRVMVLDHGKLIQQGSHGDLLEEAGLYRDIYSAQRFMGGEGV